MRDADLVGLKRFAEEFSHCWACGFEAGRSHGMQWLEVHHIAKPGRNHCRENLSRLCSLCHRAAEGERVVLDDGVRLPVLRFDHILWLKAKHDRQHYDRKVLMKLRRRRWLPKPALPPDWYVAAYCGRHVAAWRAQEWRRLA